MLVMEHASAHEQLHLQQQRVRCAWAVEQGRRWVWWLHGVQPLERAAGERRGLQQRQPEGDAAQRC